METVTEDVYIPSMNLPIDITDVATGTGQVFMDMWPILAFSVAIIVGFGILFATKGIATRKGDRHRLK